MAKRLAPSGVFDTPLISDFTLLGLKGHCNCEIISVTSMIWGLQGYVANGLVGTRTQLLALISTKTLKAF